MADGKAGTETGRAAPVPHFHVTSFDLGHGPVEPDPAVMQSGHVSVASYVDHERFEKEAALFGTVWLNIADESDVAKPGDWIVRPVACRNVSVLITRGADGVVRAFHNICTHRGMQLLWEESGNGSRFTCPYHAWTYGSDGALRSVPDQDCFPGLDKDASALRPIHLGIWEGFIYINLAPQPAQTLEAFVAPLAGRFQDLPIKHFSRQATMGARIKCNWKLLLEAQSESYHIRALHARTVSSMMSYSGNPFCHPLYWEALGPHRSWSTSINPQFELSDARPVQQFAFTASAQIITTANPLEDTDSAVNGFRGSEPIDRGDPALWAADNMIVFPHVQINAGANGCWMHRFWPISENETDWQARYYYYEPVSLRQEFAQHYATAFNRDTLVEDNNACTRQQNSMKSGAIDHIQFGMQEMACRHSAAVVKTAIDQLHSLPLA